MSPTCGKVGSGLLAVSLATDNCGAVVELSTGARAVSSWLPAESVSEGRFAAGAARVGAAEGELAGV
ncbi:MAG TPA: hypothetical protein VL486_00035 [Verrucomicrobiae bacterium]|nr:hypothetical protein [Verrucomicrobiae bacterium]